MKIVTVVGARPQFIKSAILSRALREAGLVEALIHTGQHFDANMSEVFFQELGMQAPAFNLGVGGGTHGENTGRMLERIERVLLDSPPDLVLVYGDTDSTVAGVLAASKMLIPVAHVEAGLRSFDRRMPEEQNRIVADHLSDVCLAPTGAAVENLSREGILDDRVELVGDVMYDAALHYGRIAEERASILPSLELEPDQFVLLTLHRKENVDDQARLREIVSGLELSGATIILPLHPRTRARLAEFSMTLPGNVRVTEPLGYLDMVQLERAARLVATDSGGVQKEAFFHGTPCVTIRDHTEWVELVEVGANVLVPAVADEIAKEICSRRQPVIRTDLYGGGEACSTIVDVLNHHFGAN